MLVVVKVQRPGIEEIMRRDLAALSLVADLAQRRTEFGQGIRSGELLGQFSASLRAELDFRQEAGATAEMASSAASSCSCASSPQSRAMARPDPILRLHVRARRAPVT